MDRSDGLSMVAWIDSINYSCIEWHVYFVHSIGIQVSIKHLGLSTFASCIHSVKKLNGFHYFYFSVTILKRKV